MREPSHVASARAPARPTRVLLVAGEASGDMHGADLLRALRSAIPDVEVFGLGGPELKAAGMDVLADASEVATVGVVEGLGRLRALLRTYRMLRRTLREDAPDLCIFIDFPEFNLRLAKVAKRAGVPVMYYIGPQVWAWRRGRVRTIAGRVDRLAVVFPFEPALYQSLVPGVEFVGHPLIDRVTVGCDRNRTLANAGLDPRGRTVLLLPGSRRKEIEYLLPPFLEAADRLSSDPALQFVLPLAPTLARGQVEHLITGAKATVRVVEGSTYDLMAAADLALVSSGTATLECALAGCPMVIAYRLAPVTAMLARVLVRGVAHFGMPNIVAGREIVPELMQEAVSGERIASEAMAILYDERRRQTMVEDLAGVRSRLGGGGAARRAARMAADLIDEART